MHNEIFCCIENKNKINLAKLINFFFVALEFPASSAVVVAIGNDGVGIQWRERISTA